MTLKHRNWTGLVFIASSVDGYIARPDGDLAWLTDPPAEDRHALAQEGDDAPPDYDAFTAGVSHLVMGRGTYEKILTFGFWPYDRFRVLTLSTTLAPDTDSRMTVVRSIDEAHTALDEDRATSVYVDGGQVLSSFMAADLIDELTISRAPIILGEGLPLFHPMPASTRLIHQGTSTTKSGMTCTRYQVVR